MPRALRTPFTSAADVSHVEATLPHLHPTVAAMVKLQLLTGMRPGEVSAIQMRDIDTSAASGAARANCRTCRAGSPCPDHVCWVYRPARQRDAGSRFVCLGPKCQAIIGPFITDQVGDHLFRPEELPASGRPGGKRERPRYRPQSYAEAIRHAADRADAAARERMPGLPPPVRAVPRWRAEQLRQSAWFAFLRNYGLETAAVLLGRCSLVRGMERDAGRELRLAARIMAAAG